MITPYQGNFNKRKPLIGGLLTVSEAQSFDIKTGSTAAGKTAMGLEGPSLHKECEGCWGPPEVKRDMTASSGTLTGTTSLVTARLGDFKPLLQGTERTDFYYLPTLHLETNTALFCEHFLCLICV